MAIRNFFDILPDLQFIISKKQLPLSKFYFLQIKASDLINEKSQDDSSLNVCNIFDEVKQIKNFSITSNTIKIANKEKFVELTNDIIVKMKIIDDLDINFVNQKFKISEKYC